MDELNIAVNDIYMHVLKEHGCSIVINYGGRDSGKSYFTGGQYIPLHMEQDKYFRGVCVRRTYASLKDSCYQEITDGIVNMGLAYRFEKPGVSPLEIKHKNGNKMIFRGLDDKTNLKSLKGISYIWVEEAEKLTATEFFDLLILLRAGDNPIIDVTFNPTDEDHFVNDMFVNCPADEVLETFDDGDKKVWIKTLKVNVDGVMIEIKALILRSTFDDNAYISPLRKAVIEQLQFTDPYLYEVYRKGLFGKRGGRILYNVEEIDFTSEMWEFKNFDNRGYAQDFGYNHANAILSVAEYDGCLFVFDELYGYETTVNTWITKANKKGLDKELRMICDCASPDPIKTWSDAGYSSKAVYKFPGSVRAQIDRLKEFKKIYVNSTCINTVKEARGWKYKQVKKTGKFTDVPVDIYDDAMAALRYSTDLFYTTEAGMITVK